MFYPGRMVTSLADALPGAEFVEFHSLVIDAASERVWQALQDVTWADLRVTTPLLVARGLGSLAGRRRRLFDDGPVRLVHTQPGQYVAGGRIARPWQLVPALGPEVSTLDELAAQQEGSWLKYGMDFHLHPLCGNRTRLETTTLCEPTDEHARRRFSAYWVVIRPFSGLVRRDMLHAVARRARRLN